MAGMTWTRILTESYISLNYRGFQDGNQLKPYTGLFPSHVMVWDLNN